MWVSYYIESSGNIDEIALHTSHPRENDPFHLYKDMSISSCTGEGNILLLEIEVISPMEISVSASLHKLYPERNVFSFLNITDINYMETKIHDHTRTRRISHPSTPNRYIILMPYYM